MKSKSLTAPAAMMFLLFFLLGNSLFSQVRPHHIFDNNMVLQRDQPVKVWGWADPSEKINIEFGGQVKSTAANPQGEWFVYLDPISANSNPQDLKVSGKTNSVVFTNVLVGDIWILGGQSNMEMDLARLFHGDAETLSANFPNIRLMTIPSSAGQLPKKDFERINEYDDWLDRHDKKAIGLPAPRQLLQHFQDWAIFSAGEYIWSARYPLV